MKKKILAMFAAAMLLLGMSACDELFGDSDNPVTPSQQELEESLIGLWYEEFEYKDVTEDGKPFNRALIAVEAKADHTGYVALAVFDLRRTEGCAIYMAGDSRGASHPDRPEYRHHLQFCMYPW